MSSWTFRVPSNQTEGIKMSKEKICQVDGRLVCEGTEASVSGEKKEFSR